MGENDRPLTFQEELDRRPLRLFQIMLVALLLFVLVIDGIDIQLLSLVAPVIISEWGVARADFGTALAGALVGMSLGAFVGGWLGDRFGRLPMLVASVLGFGMATVVAGTTSSVGAMTIWRILSGIGFGAAAPNAMALASEWLPERAKPQVTSLLSIGTPAGGMIGATLVLVVLPTWGWRATFFMCGGMTLALAVLLFLRGRESPSFLAGKGLVERARKVADRSLGISFSANAGRSESIRPADHPRIFTAANARLNLGAGLGFFAIAFVSYALVAWTTVMLTGFGFAMEQAVSALFSFNLAAVVSAITAGFTMRRLGSRATMAGSSTLLLSSVLGLAAILDGPEATGRATSVVVLIGCAGGFAGAAMASIYAMMAAGYAVTCRAAGIGLGMMLGRGGGIAASIAGGHLLDAQRASAWVFLGALALAAAAGLCCAFISDRHLEPASRSSNPRKGRSLVK